jgi:hypothetical protein
MSAIATRTSLGRQQRLLDLRPGDGRDLRPGGPEGTTPRRRHNGGACSDGSSLTLEQRISRVWEGLAVAGATETPGVAETPGAAECPVCEAPAMELRGGIGICRSCGSRLS